MSDCAINSVRSLPRSEASTSDSRSESAGAIPFEWLVQQQASGADGQRAAERDELLLAPAEQERLAIAHLGELADHAVDEVEPCLAVEMPGDPQGQQDVFFHRQLRHQAAVLRHVADPERGAPVSRLRRQIRAFEADRALRGPEVAHDRADQRGLAGAVAADEAYHGALVDPHGKAA